MESERIGDRGDKLITQIETVDLSFDAAGG